MFIRLPFSVYFGWITVATIANITTALVDIGWDGFGISESIWTILIIVIGLVIGAVTMIRNHDIAYAADHLGLCRHPDQAHVPGRLCRAIHRHHHDRHRLYRTDGRGDRLRAFREETSADQLEMITILIKL